MLTNGLVQVKVHVKEGQEPIDLSLNPFEGATDSIREGQAEGKFSESSHISNPWYSTGRSHGTLL